MPKPLDQFGGWLKFFYVILWIGAVSLIVVSVLIGFALLTEGSMLEKRIMAISLVELSVTTVLIIKILRLVKTKQPDVPTQIFRLMVIVVLVALSFGAIEAIVLYLANGFEGLKELKDTGKGILSNLTSFAIWSSYFMTSKRVRAYYGDVAWVSKKQGA